MQQSTEASPVRSRRRRSANSLYVGLAGFRSALRRFLTFSDVALGSVGVTSQQYQAMLCLAASTQGSLSMKELAEEMLVKPNGAVQLVDRLEASGLVTRTPSATDGRGVSLSLTAEGRGVIKVLATEHRSELLKHSGLLLESLKRLEDMGGSGASGG